MSTNIYMCVCVHGTAHVYTSPPEAMSPRKPGSSQELLDERKRQLTVAVARDFSPRQIRAQSLANLHRRKSRGTWIARATLASIALFRNRQWLLFL
jgi:hypothetical protein